MDLLLETHPVDYQGEILADVLQGCVYVTAPLLPAEKNRDTKLVKLLYNLKLEINLKFIQPLVAIYFVDLYFVLWIQYGKSFSKLLDLRLKIRKQQQLYKSKCIASGYFS